MEFIFKVLAGNSRPNVGGRCFARRKFAISGRFCPASQWLAARWSLLECFATCHSRVLPQTGPTTQMWRIFNLNGRPNPTLAPPPLLCLHPRFLRCWSGVHTLNKIFPEMTWIDGGWFAFLIESGRGERGGWRWIESRSVTLTLHCWDMLPFPDVLYHYGLVLVLYAIFSLIWLAGKVTVFNTVALYHTVIE